MKKNSLFLVGIFLCFCISTTLVQQAFSQQKLSQPVRKTTVTGKIDQFLKVLQGAKSLKEVQTAFNRAKFSKTEVRQLQGKIKSSSSLEKKLDGLYNQATAAARVESAKMNRQEAKRTAMAKAQLNKRLTAAHLKSVSKIRQSVAAISMDPEVRCQADTPTIRDVSDVMPGVQFAIRGKGFGKDPGRVNVCTGGHTFRALIKKWNSCVVYAQLSYSNISGVRSDDQSIVDLKTSAGKEISHSTRFTPLMETKFYSESDLLKGWFWGDSKDYIFWNRVLKNDWYVLGTGIKHHSAAALIGGHAEITQAPPQNTLNCSTRTKVHAGVPGFGKCYFYVFQRIAGPLGMSPY